MIYLFLFISLMTLNGCEQKSLERQYTEVVIEAPKAGMLAMTDPHAGMGISVPGAMMPVAHTADLTWTLPQGWMEGAAGGMRLATFHLKNAPQDIDVSVVVLDGMAGGLEANLSRWLGQIQLSAAENDLKKLIAEAQGVRTKDRSEAKIYDLTALTGDSNAASMIVAIISVNSKTVFVKMTGNKNNCRKQKDGLLDLVRSISAP